MRIIANFLVGFIPARVCNGRCLGMVAIVRDTKDKEFIGVLFHGEFYCKLRSMNMTVCLSNSRTDTSLKQSPLLQR